MENTNTDKSRRRWLALGIATVLVASGAFVHGLRTRGYEETDDAFVDAHVAPISSKVSGRVLAVRVDDNQPVKEGDVLVELDPADLKVEAARARAELSAAE